MGRPQDIKNKVQQKAQGNNGGGAGQSAPTPQEPKGELTWNQQMEQTLDKIKPTLGSILQEQFNSERFARLALSEVRKNPQLAKCSQLSIAGAVVQSAIVGLEFGPHQHVYIVPRWSSKIGSLEAEFQIGYKGYIELASRTGRVAFVRCEIVYEDDEFDFEYGTNQNLYHKPNLESATYGDPNHAVKYYTFMKYKDGSEQFLVRTRQQMVRHMERFAPQNKQKQVVGPWVSDFDSMALKTTIHQLFKTVAITPEFANKISRDGTIANDPDNPRSFHDYIDMEETEERAGA